MLDRTIRFPNLKEMIYGAAERYSEKPAYYVGGENRNTAKVITYKDLYNEMNNIGTALIEMGLKGKRIAVISENRYEWEIAYLAICCGVGVVVPLDKALPANEIESLIVRSEVEAIFYSSKYDETMAKIQKQGNTNLKYFISMDLEQNEFRNSKKRRRTPKTRKYRIYKSRNQ